MPKHTLVLAAFLSLCVLSAVPVQAREQTSRGPGRLTETPVKFRRAGGVGAVTVAVVAAVAVVVAGSGVPEQS